MKIVFLVSLLALPSFSFATDNSRYAQMIQKSLDKQPSLCLGETSWPVSLTKGESVWVNARMAALVDAGLAQATQSAHQKNWSLTEAGKRAFKKHGDFCYGHMRIKKIERIINKGGGYHSIIFYYEIESMPPWANNKSVRMAYSELDNLVMGINSARYQADFLTKENGSINIIAEPYQLDLLY